MSGRAKEKEEEEDGTYWDVNSNRRCQSEASSGGWIWRGQMHLT